MKLTDQQMRNFCRELSAQLRIACLGTVANHTVEFREWLDLIADWPGEFDENPDEPPEVFGIGVRTALVKAFSRIQPRRKK